MHACMHACMYVYGWMDVWMYVCMYIANTLVALLNHSTTLYGVGWPAERCTLPFPFGSRVWFLLGARAELAAPDSSVDSPLMSNAHEATGNRHQATCNRQQATCNRQHATPSSLPDGTQCTRTISSVFAVPPGITSPLDEPCTRR